MSPSPTRDMKFTGAPCARPCGEEQPVAMREVRDATGTVWTVFDVMPSTNRRALSQVKPGYTAGWLCFQCTTERRRHPGVPTAWSQLPDDAIVALLESAAETRLAPLRDV